MADRVQISARIVTSDQFLNLPHDSQVYYFHLCFNANPKGVSNNPISIAKAIGVDVCAIQPLVNNGYVIPVGCGEVSIAHWIEHKTTSERANRNNHFYRKWRFAVLERDGKCMSCGSVDNLVAHHIESFANNPQLRMELSNGITLCESCHRQLHWGKRNG